VRAPPPTELGETWSRLTSVRAARMVDVCQGVLCALCSRLTCAGVVEVRWPRSSMCHVSSPCGVRPRVQRRRQHVHSTCTRIQHVALTVCTDAMCTDACVLRDRCCLCMHSAHAAPSATQPGTRMCTAYAHRVRRHSCAVERSRGSCLTMVVLLNKICVRITRASCEVRATGTARCVARGRASAEISRVRRGFRAASGSAPAHGP